MRKIDPERHNQRRRQILEAAARCFRREGYRGASMSAICAEAGMSPGHLYHYFANKEALVQAHVDQSLELSIDQLTMDAAPLGAELFDAIVELAVREARHLAENAPRHAFKIEIAAEATRNPLIAAILRTKTEALAGKIADLLRFGQSHGVIDRFLVPETAALMLISLVQGTAIPPMNDPEFFSASEKYAMVALTVRRLLEPRAE